MQALVVIKVQISIHQKKALSELCQTIIVANFVDAGVTCAFNFSLTDFS